MKKNIIILILLISTFLSAREIKIENIIDKNGIIYVKGESSPFTGVVKDKKNREYYRDGVPHGKWLTFYSNGVLKSIENWKYGKLNGKYVLYNKDGDKMMENNYSDGRDEGRFQLFYPDGKLRMEGYFKNGTVTGEWKNYDTHGKIIGKIQY